MLKIFIILFFLLTINHQPSTIYGAFKDQGFGARPSGMGSAFTAVADDTSAILYNPAGICQIEQLQGNFMYSKLYTGLETVNLGLNYAAVAFPVNRFGGFGVSWANFTAEHYREDTLTLSYGRSIIIPEVAIGLNIKFLQHSFVLDKRTIDDPVFSAEKSKSNFTVDLGIYSQPFPEYLSNLSAGIMIKNITQPDVGLKTKDIVPIEFRIGLGWKINKFKLVREILSTVDITYRNQEWGKQEDKLNLHLGSEAWFVDELLGIRIGGNLTELSFGFGIKTPKWMSDNRHSDPDEHRGKNLFRRDPSRYQVRGQGDKRVMRQPLKKFKLNLQLDYAFLYPLQLQQTTGSHKVAIVWRWK